MSDIIHTVTEIIPIYNPKNVILSFGISFLGAYMTIALCEQYRLNSTSARKLSLINYRIFLGLMALSLGGIGIWCMHFVGMSALKLKSGDTYLKIQFDTARTFISLLFVIIFAFAGLFISSFDKVFGKDKEDIVEMFVQDATRELSLQGVKKLTNTRVLIFISTHSLKFLICGGLCAGSGVCVMHYVGMWAMEFENGVIEWDIGLIATSLVIANVAATAAFWILFRLLSIYPRKENLRLASSFLMAVAVCGMHYTGMAAASFKYVGDLGLPSGHKISQDDAFFGSLTASIITLWLLAILILADLRSWLYKISSKLKRALAFIDQLKNEPGLTVANNNLFRQYELKDKLEDACYTPNHSMHSHGGNSSYRIKPVGPGMFRSPEHSMHVMDTHTHHDPPTVRQRSPPQDSRSGNAELSGRDTATASAATTAKYASMSDGKAFSVKAEQIGEDIHGEEIEMV